MASLCVRFPQLALNLDASMHISFTVGLFESVSKQGPHIALVMCLLSLFFLQLLFVLPLSLFFFPWNLLLEETGLLTL